MPACAQGSRRGADNWPSSPRRGRARARRPGRAFRPRDDRALDRPQRREQPRDADRKAGRRDGLRAEARDEAVIAPAAADRAEADGPAVFVLDIRRSARPRRPGRCNIRARARRRGRREFGLRRSRRVADLRVPQIADSVRSSTGRLFRIAASAASCTRVSSHVKVVQVRLPFVRSGSGFVVSLASGPRYPRQHAKRHVV